MSATHEPAPEEYLAIDISKVYVKWPEAIISVIEGTVNNRNQAKFGEKERSRTGPRLDEPGEAGTGIEPKAVRSVNARFLSMGQGCQGGKTRSIWSTQRTFSLSCVMFRASQTVRNMGDDR
jgi:hypothetical protein